MKKYELTDIINPKWWDVHLRRIRALRDIPRYNVQAGDLGGWLGSENNLSQDGDCWVGDNAWVSGYTRVEDNAWVKENAWVADFARVSGNAIITGNARVAQHGVISSTQDYLVVSPIGSRDDRTTFYRTASGTWVRCGCFNGSIDEFEAAVKKTHGDNPHARAYLKAIELAKIQLPEGQEQNLKKLISRWKQELNRQIEYGFGVNKLAVTAETIDALELLLKTTQRKED